MTAPARFTSPDLMAERIIQRAGPNLVVALPLGLGKANHVVNALYHRVAGDPRLSLTILTALTLEKPTYGNDLQRRLLEPVVERLFGGYPELRYAADQRRGTLPDNVRIEEFFFLAGSQLGSPVAQQNHICANYTHARRYILERNINVLAQLVAEDQGSGPDTRFSASCNPDLTLDMLAARRAGEADFLFVGQVNDELPFMGGDAVLAESEFDGVLTGDDCQFPLFAPPNGPVSMTDYAAGLQVARLIPDGGTLQIGIGGLGDAVAHSLILRHRDNDRFRQVLAALGSPAPFQELAPFRVGLHGLSEMLVEGFLHLMDAGVLAREVDGKLLHAAFFLGSRRLYQRLRDMDATTRNRIAMGSIHFTNELLGDERGKRRGRVGARFVNKAMMATLRGEVISDALEDGRVVSGVGGQFDFVSQAFALPDARSIIVVPAVRSSGGRALSNIRWSYGNTTVPRHLRDIVVTEYGIADLRGKTDSQVIAAMLAVTDSRFQDDLLEQAKKAGKIAFDYVIPGQCRDNTPQRLRNALAPALADGTLPKFPLGSDFTAVELELVAALEEVSACAHSRRQLVALALEGLGADAHSFAEGLERMALAAPRGWRQRLERLLLLGGLARSHQPSQQAR